MCLNNKDDTDYSRPATPHQPGKPGPVLAPVPRFLKRSNIWIVGLLTLASSLYSPLQGQDAASPTNVKVVSSDYLLNSSTNNRELLHFAPDEVSEVNKMALNKIISVDFRDFPMEKAFHEIATLADIEIAYSKDIAQNIWDKLVTVQYDRATVLGALYAVLGDSGLKLTLSAGSGRSYIVIVDDEEDENSPPAPRVQEQGILSGRIIDSTTGDVLIGANVVLVNTTIGTASGPDGRYTLRNLPAGNQILEIRYLGYITKQIEVTIQAGETVERDIELNPEVLEGDEIVLLTQALGQARAIQEQLRANTIMNVVSEDRISELPDQNTAEAIARLPGISLERDGGEGQKVIIRGLSPKFSNVTVDGTKLPGTDADDRSTDLSMISPDVLSGIQVFKAITPDMDGDAVGGTVNLSLRQATPVLDGMVQLQSGYNDLVSEFGQFRGSFSINNRFFDDKLGVILTGNAQRANRSSHRFTADYDAESARPKIITDRIVLDNRQEIRNRYGGNIGLDYRLDRGRIFLNSFAGITTREEERWRKRYRVADFRTEHDARNTSTNVYLITNSLRGEHAFDFFDLTWNTTYSKTIRDVPKQNYIRFVELAAFDSNLLVEDEGPELIPLAAKNNLDQTTLLYSNFGGLNVDDRDITSQIDIRVPYRAASNVSGYFKFGGKFIDKHRNNDAFERQTPFSETDKIGREHNDEFSLHRGAILIGNFLDPDFSTPNFLNNDAYDFNAGVDIGLMNDFINRFESRFDTNRAVQLRDYTANERTFAGYIMKETQIGNRIMFLPGVRIEQTTTDYDAYFGRLQGDLGRSGVITDTTGGQSYVEILPMAHLKIDLTNNLDLRLAATRTLSRPDFFNLTPFENINIADRTVERGNPNLKHAKIWNFDAFLSFYSGRYGLITLGGFYKSIDDIDFIARTFDRNTGLTENFILTTPINAQTSTVRGVELDVQSNLGFLPRPLDGLLLSFNVARMESETFFPILIQKGRSPDPPFQPVFADSVRSGNMPGQSDIVLNLSIGYEISGFSARASYIYQSDAISQVGESEVRDLITDDIHRWDLTASQNISSALTIRFSVNNLTNYADNVFFGERAFPTNTQLFGWTADLGVRYRF